MTLNSRYIRSIVLHWEKLQARSYLRKIACIANLKTLEFTKNITFFVGSNGSGKSTLLRAIAEGYGFNPEGGSFNFQFSSSIGDVDEDTGYYDYENHSTLADILTFVKGYRRPKPYMYTILVMFNSAFLFIEHNTITDTEFQDIVKGFFLGLMSFLVITVPCFSNTRVDDKYCLRAVVKLNYT